MRNFKKFLTLVLAVMMVVSAMSFTTSAAFEDVSADNEYLADAVSLLNYMGVAKGVSETKFGTDELVTRQQFALFIYRLMKGGKDAPANGGNVTNFKDLTDPTYNYAIGWAAQQGIVTGRSATAFDPKGAITLQEAYTMIVRALKYEADGEKLQYPFGYIEVAEAEDVDLAEGLASTVDYTDALTRGDMAILLYNAFFAKMGVATIDYKEIVTENGAYLVEEETYPVLCEDVFGVKTVEYQVVATPHYQTTDTEATNDLGYDAVLLAVEEDENIDKSPVQVYLTPDDLGVDADKLDDLFLAHFELYVVHGDKAKAGDYYEIDKVLYANSAMTKKTVNDLKFATVTTNNANSYFDTTDAKILSGKVTTGTDVIYFYNAPYSYANPSYTSTNNPATMYTERNEENIGTVSFELVDEDKGIYEATVAEIAIESALDEDETDGLYVAEATKLVDDYTEAYYGGLYEADIYDVDGDGLYDYIDYKPYVLFQVDTDDEMEFVDNDFSTIASDIEAGKIPVIYTNEATLLGEKFENEDYVIGYYSQDNNVVKVATVLKPTTATIKSYKKAEKTITLSDNTTVALDGAWKYVANYAPRHYDDVEKVYVDDVQYDVEAYEGFDAFDALLDAEYINDEELNLYIYDGVVLHQEGAKSANLKFTDNLIIPTTYSKKNVTPRTVDEKFDTDLGEYVTRIYAWVDGDLKWVTIETEDVYPVIVANGDVTADYLDQLCTYTVDSDGVYTITSLENAEDEDKTGDEKYVGINWGYDENDVWTNLGATVLKDTEEDDLQYLGKVAGPVFLTKFAGTRFDLEGANLGYRFNFTDYTKIIIKNTKHKGTDDEKVEYIEYDATTFNTSSEVELYNVAYIVANDADSTTRENLVVLYAEAEDFDLKGASTSTGYRIIANSDVNIDENDYYRNYYTVYDPFTGKKAEVTGNDSASKATQLAAAKAVGSVVELKDGKVDEDEAVLDALDINSTDFLAEIDGGDAKAGTAWIVEYSESDKILMLAPVGGCWNDVEEGTIESYQVDNNTAVSMIKYPDNNNKDSFVQWGTMSLLTTADLASTSTDYKCYNTKVEDNKGNYKTGYAKYIKAYVVTENETNLEDGELNKVTMVVVLVHSNEAETYLTTHTAKLHEECSVQA